MKLLTFNGPKGHFFEVPGFFKIAAGESHEIDEHVAEAVVNANPKVPLTVTDAPKKSAKSASKAASQPEAHEGEGQPEESTDQEE